MARPELSSELHTLHGTRSQRKTATVSAMLRGRPRTPKNLSPIALEKWKEIVRILARRGTLTPGDGPQIELTAETFARWRLYADDVHKRGAYITEKFQDKNGDTYERETPNPSTKLATQMENALRASLKELGITPASRDRMKPALPPNSAEIQRQKEAAELEKLRAMDLPDIDELPPLEMNLPKEELQPAPEPAPAAEEKRPPTFIGRTDEEEEQMRQRWYAEHQG